MTNEHLVTPLHLERLALVCAPTAPLTEGTGERTAGLALLASKLGWPTDRIVTISSLMGQSHGQSCNRAILERLLDEISEWRVGAIFGLEQSRIARSSHDFFQLLDSCRATGTLLVRDDSIHAPALHRELVVLGHQELSDFEAWIVRGCLLGFKHDSEDRFDLSFALPVGYVRDRLAIRKNPNPAVRESIAEAISALRKFETAGAAAQALAERGVQLPYRDRPDGTVYWATATPDRVFDLIHSPCMAGAHLYGRCHLQRASEGRVRPRRVLAVGMHGNRTLLVMNHHDGYLAWGEWIELQVKLSLEAYDKLYRRVNWKGSRLLLGLAVCGHCGQALDATDGSGWTYGCRNRRHPGGRGRCVPVLGALVDSEAVTRFISTALPGGFEASRHAVERFPAMADELVRARWLTVDRREYSAALAYRRHRDIGVEFVRAARALKRKWDLAEAALSEARESFDRTRAERPDLAIPTLFERFARLGARLEVVWNAHATTNPERRRLLRILLEEVELRPEPELGWVRMLMRWKGGATDEEWLPLR